MERLEAIKINVGLTEEGMFITYQKDKNSILVRHNNEGYCVEYTTFNYDDCGGIKRKLTDVEYGVTKEDAAKAVDSWINRGYKA